MRSTECTKRVSFTGTRLRYEFKLATVCWLKLLLVSNALNSFRTAGVPSPYAIVFCLLFLTTTATTTTNVKMI